MKALRTKLSTYAIALLFVFGFSTPSMAGSSDFAGISQTDQDQTSTTYNGDVEEKTMYIKYAAAGFTLGYQWSEEDMGTAASEMQYDNTGYGITFQVNDDLSIGYNHYESEQTNSTNVTAEALSLIHI